MNPSRILIAAPLLFALPAFAQGPPPPGAPHGGPMGGPQFTPAQEINEYLTLDRNADGNLSKDEIPARFQGLITRADTDHDGVVSSEELVQMVSKRFAAKAKHGEERGGPGSPPRGGMPPGDLNEFHSGPRLDAPETSRTLE